MSIPDKTDIWVTRAKEENKKIFSELDVLLRSLDRSFYVESLPLSGSGLRDRDFYHELVAVRDVVFRVLAILEVVIPESRKNAHWFQKFAESRFLTGSSRDMLRENLYRQDTPEKSIYILYDLFINIKGVVTDLLKTGHISYFSYGNIGHLITKGIRENIFFNPFRQTINPALDMIENPRISEIVRSIGDRETRKYFSLLYVRLFRLLRFLSHIDIASQDAVSLHSSSIILLLIRSEIDTVSQYLRKISDIRRGKELKALLNSLSYQFTMESKRVFSQELKGMLANRSPRHFRGKIENSHGILKNLIEQSIVQISQFFRPDIRGEDILPGFTSRIQSSMKLHEDLLVLHRFIVLLEEKMSLPEGRTGIFESMRDFMCRFENSTFKLLRYDDYDEFSSFFRDFLVLKESELNKCLEKIHNFRILLETTIRQVANRAELRDREIDRQRVDKLLQEYVELSI